MSLRVKGVALGVARRISKHEVQTEGQSLLSQGSWTLCVTAVASDEVPGLPVAGGVSDLR